MATAEVLPIVVTAQDNSASAFAALKGHLAEASRAVGLLKGNFEGLGGGSASSLSQIGQAVSLLRNPYAAAAVAIAAVGTAAVMAHRNLSNMAETASMVGLKASEIDGLGRAMHRAGGDADMAASGLKELRTQLDTVKNDGGFLEDLFRLNGKALYDARDQVRPIKDVYRDLAQLIQNAENQTQRLSIATKVFGQEAGPSVVKSILAGNDAINALQDASLDPVVAQAREFDRLWKEITRSTDGLASSIRSMVLPVISGVYDKVLALASLVGSESAKQSRYILNNPNASRAMDNQDDIDRFYAGIFRGTNLPTNRKDDSFTGQEYTRAINSITKHIALMKADAESVGLSAAAHEELRIKAQLDDAARRARLDPLGKEAQKYAYLAQEARQYLELKTRLTLQNQIKFDRDTMFLSETDKQIAQALRDLYGSDIPAAMASSEAAALRLNAAMKDFNDIGKDAFSSLVDAMRDGKLEMSELSGVLDNISKRLMKMAADKLWEQAMGGLFGAGGFNFFGMFGASAGQSGGVSGLSRSAEEVIPSALGNVFAGGSLVPFARGGVVHRPTVFPMARGAGLMGEAGPEAIIPLMRDGGGRLGVKAQGVGQNNVQVNVINNVKGTEVETRKRQDGGVDVHDIIISSVNRGIGSGELDTGFGANYGVGRRVPRR